MNQVLFLDQINKAIRDSLDNSSFVGVLKPVLEYCLFPGGKRIRPLISLAVCNDLGGDANKLVSPSIALELLHTASLLHDDLPALDNDDMRRGKASCHCQFGEATAILAGDFLIAWAFEAITRDSVYGTTTVAMVNLIASAFKELCLGQQLDILEESHRPSASVVHQHKTGSLFRASFGLGALSATSKHELVRELCNLGDIVGGLFQIVDDFIDVFGVEGVKGRLESSDTRNGRMSVFSSYEEGVSAMRKKKEVVRSLFMSIHDSTRLEFNRTKSIIDAILEPVQHVLD